MAIEVKMPLNSVYVVDLDQCSSILYASLLHMENTVDGSVFGMWE